MGDWVGRRFALVTLVAMVAANLSSPGHADSGTIRISLIKGGWVIGASAGSGTLTFKGRSYPLTVGGVKAGLVFGGSVTELVGTVRNITRASDVAGVYGALGAGTAVVGGVRVMELRNDKGAVLSLRGREVGLELDLDLSGTAIGLK